MPPVASSKKIPIFYQQSSQHCTQMREQKTSIQLPKNLVTKKCISEEGQTQNTLQCSFFSCCRSLLSGPFAGLCSSCSDVLECARHTNQNIKAKKTNGLQGSRYSKWTKKSCNLHTHTQKRHQHRWRKPFYCRVNRDR